MLKTLATCLLTILTACTINGTGSDPGDPFPPPPTGSDSNPDTSSLTGVVEIDAAIQNAVVYLDQDGDNLLTPGEPWTTTDATGHYTITWPSWKGQFAFTVGAIVNADSIRVGTGMPVGFAVHMRAPLYTTYNLYNEKAVISPLTTLVASGELWNGTYNPVDAEAQLVASLKASNVPFSSQPLDLMSDYVATYKTSSDSAQLRFLASAIAATVSDAVNAGNAAQSRIDCNDNMIFTPAIAALDNQLTPLANAVYKFELLTPAAQADIQSSGNYQSYFINASDLATAIENELEASAEQFAADLFAQIRAEFVAQLEEDVVRIVAGELIAELLG